MHFIGLFAAVFAALWLWSWTERRRQAKLLRPPRAKLTMVDQIGHVLTIIAGALVCIVVVAAIAIRALTL